MVEILIGDVRENLRAMPADHFDCVVTSPPYWGLRDYGTAIWVGGDKDCDHRSPTMREGRNEDRPKLAGSAATNSAQNILAHNSNCGKCGAVKVDQQIGLERTLGEHLAVMVEVFGEVHRVLKPTGTLWLNYGDCYATAPNGRSAADTKAVGNDDRTFRDKPFSTIGGVLKSKDLCMIPNRLAIALQEAGWWVRSEIIWHKPNPMPESIRDRPTSSHEKIWLMTKRERYFYDADAISEPVTASTVDRVSQANWPKQVGSDRANAGGKTNGNMKAVVKRAKDSSDGARPPNSRPHNLSKFEANHNREYLVRNARNVWTMGTAAFSEAHFATFPAELAERCIKAGCPAGGSVLDPFGGAGTTGVVAASLGRLATLIELNPEYAKIARTRIDAAFMGREEGARHMVRNLGKLDVDAGPLFATRP